jgi:DNA helicase II / ATP-dependent DNA helicase PcrA
VIAEFARIVSRQFDFDYRRSPKFCAKAVGAVGNEIDPEAKQLKIGHYWSAYSKNKAATTLKLRSLIECARYCRGSSSADWAHNHKTLVATVLELLKLARIADADGRYFSPRTLRAHLESAGTWEVFRRCLYMILNDCHQAPDFNEHALAYIQFTDEPPRERADDQPNELSEMPGNMVRCADHFSIALSTIHGVKGETHDATLVMETKYYGFDVGVMIPYLTGEAPSDANPNSRMRPTPQGGRPNMQFMKQLYVAMSRPKHLLCLAVHSDRMTDDHAQLLRHKGWAVVRLSADGYAPSQPANP